MNQVSTDKKPSPYDVLFEPVKIGPKTAPNRFYQVPHGSGMGYRHPQSLAAMRGTKAEGGWGVVCSEYTTVHPSMDDTPHPFAALWTDDDIRANAMVADAIHEHGALSAVELCIAGNATGNLLSRTPAYGVTSVPVWEFPWQTRRADKRDIKHIRRWHKEAAQRAITAGHDIVYVYATHNYFLSQFLWADYNTRNDEYGGSLKNRVRLVREIIEDTLDAVAGRCAVAVRFSVDQGLSQAGTSATDETREMLALLADLPDLWDLNVHDWYREIGPSRFYQEGMLENFISYARDVVKQPIVSTGRFTSPDTMVRQIKSGHLDFIGAARPSIADPFLPRKIKEGRADDIRECIGCNICYTGTYLNHPIRCTQNPAMGMEWQRGWHPERVTPVESDNSVLIVGAGPAGLEAALSAAKRGYRVALAEAGTELGGRVHQESRLPGLNEWRRVVEHRIHQLQKQTRVDIYLDSRLDAEHIVDFGFNHVLLATGARWRNDGVGRSLLDTNYSTDSSMLFSVNSVLAGDTPSAQPADGPIVIYDDDGYYMAAVIALQCQRAGFECVLVCSQGTAAHWSQYTEELPLVNAQLLNEGVKIISSHAVCSLSDTSAILRCLFSGKEIELACSTLIPVTARIPNDSLYYDLINLEARWQAAGLLSVTRVGDCIAPGIIAQAVHSGREAAMELDVDVANKDVREYRL
ncbi:MAG: FAD-dependent oxidoreductase [Pseudomonadales bacterium]